MLGITYKDGFISADLLSLMKATPPDQKRGMIEALSCDDDLIDFVTQQILDRFTENSFGGGVFVTAQEAPVSGLDRAWREVAKRSGEVAKREIERLEEALRVANEEINELRTDLRSYRTYL